jgi:ABC-2 type transport system permease protein
MPRCARRWTCSSQVNLRKNAHVVDKTTAMRILLTLSVALAFGLKSHSQFFPITGFVSLPLTFASSALVPFTLMPGWMAALARLNPMTYAINGVRTIVLSGWQAGPLLRITAILTSFDLICLMIAAVTLRRGLR